jgi:hypothetical protein
MKSTTHNRGRKVTKRGLSTEQKIQFLIARDTDI